MEWMGVGEMRLARVREDKRMWKVRSEIRGIYR